MFRRTTVLPLLPPSHRRVLLVVGACLLAAWLAFTASAGAQEPDEEEPAPELGILSVVHDPAGSLVVGLRVGGARSSDVESITMFIDDVPVRIEVAEYLTADDLALALVVDASGSMEGVPIEAARSAAAELIERLPPEDRVGLIAFASEVDVLSAPTADHAGVVGMLSALEPSGDTALYEAVVAGVEALDAVTEERRVIVLLSDGRQVGGAGGPTRESSVESVADSGVVIYPVGLGAEIDTAYLEELAAATGGEVSYVSDATDVDALTSLFAQLGGALGSSETYTIPVHPLSLGEHRLEVRGFVDGQRISALGTFDVTNEGLLTATVEAAAAGESIDVHYALATSAGSLTVEVRVDGEVIPHATAEQSVVRLDPWLLSPGTREVELIALAGSSVAAREQLTIEVPPLDPQLVVEPGPGAAMVARGRIQGAPEPVLVARRNGEQVARSTGGELVLPEDGGGITVDLLDASGATVASQVIEADVGVVDGGGGSGVTVLLAILGAGAALIVVLLLRRRRAAMLARPRPTVEEGPIVPYATARRQALASAPAPEVRQREERIGVIAVIDGLGQRRDVPLTRRPLTIGRSTGCDVVLDDPEVRPQHARLSVLSPTEVRVHAVGDGAWRGDEARGDEWVVIQSGEQITLGAYRLLILLGADAPAEEDLPGGAGGHGDDAGSERA